MTEEKSVAASGVEALIERLREQGVTQGKTEAEALIAEARSRAAQMVEKAREEAREITDNARAEAERTRRGGEDALKIAARDVQLQLKEALTRMFADRVQVKVAEQLDEKALLRELLLELVRRHRDSVDVHNEVEVVLPEDFVGLEELRSNPDAYRSGQLSAYVQQLLAEELRDGLSFDTGSLKGLEIRFDDAAIDLSDHALAALLLRHLQPRFRALLEGVIR